MAPSDFFLFVCLKHELRGSRFQTAGKLPATGRKLVGEISPETLLDVFYDDVAPCESVIAIDGNFEQIIEW
jgi:hypothetical protein